MNKHLLLGTALLAAISAFPQSAKQVKPTGIINKAEQKELAVDIENSVIKTAAPVVVKKINKGLSSAKTASTGAISCTRFSGSANAFGIYQDGHEALQYNADLNAVSFVHRCSLSYTSIPNGNTGVVVAKYSTNAGTTWDSTVIWTSTSNLARYPQGGLYNPIGNTTFTNAYVVGMGETTPGSGFNGNWLASKKVTIPGNVTPGTDMQFFANTAPFGGLKKFDFARYGFTYTKDGLVRGLGEIVNDINSTTNVGRGNRGDAVIKGAFSAGAFVWSYDSLVPATILRGDGSKNLYLFNNLMAWNDAGTIGYVVMIGTKAGATGALKGWQPIIYKTTTSGASWSLLPSQDFTTPQFQAIYDRCLGVNTNSNLVVPNFATGEGMDAAVDINNNLHIATTLYGSYSTHNDSLAYAWGFTIGTEQYNYPYGNFGYPIIYDLYTTTAGGWNYHLVDSMGTEGPSGTTGQAGATSNPWTIGGVAIDARIQMAVSPDRKKMFYSWTESDTSITGNKWNIYPDIKMKGYDVTIDKVTPRVNVTGGVLTPDVADQFAYLHLMSNRAILTNTVTNTFEIPFTISYNTAYDGNQPINHYYLKGASFQQSDFYLNPMRPTGINSLANNVPSYEVNLYPNPAGQAVTVSVNLKAATNVEVSVYNSIGQHIQTIPFNGVMGSNDIFMDLSKMNSGVYFYKVKAEGSIVTKKLIIE